MLPLPMLRGWKSTIRFFLEAEQWTGERVVKRWWGQEGIDLASVWGEAATRRPEEADESDDDNTG